ncbi:MAG: class I SAM-dependent methyltransferase [Chrysiogenales bacterium]|nr:MAG: class I SAM-dependent methyltransferase [Chrysiogenales bacterium]
MEAEQWWSTWAPLWDHIEDRHFSTRVTESLIDQITSDVLVIGAGQGIIVRHLAGRGFKAVGLDINLRMVRIAKEKYGIDIVQGDAGDLPFENDSFNTVIISSGVVDYGADEDAIARFIGEARRVCCPGGTVFIAFYKIIGRIEKIYRKIGIIDSDDVYHMKRIFEINEIAEKFPPLCAVPNKKWTGKSMARVNFEWAMVGLTQPKEFRIERKWINRLFRDGEMIGLSKKDLVDSVPDSLPYRTRLQIEELLARIYVEYREIRDFDDCTVVLCGK